jgi:hypothetical protein
MEVKVRFRLADYAGALPGPQVEISTDLHRVAGAEHSIFIPVLFYDHCRTVRVEARMHDREDEAAAGPEQSGQRGKQRSDRGHVHQHHRRDNGIEAGVAESRQRRRVGGVQGTVLNPIRMFDRAFARPLQESLGQIGCQYACAGRGKVSGVRSVPTADLEDVLIGPQVEQPVHGRFDQDLVKGVSFTEAAVPECRLPFPDALGLRPQCVEIDVMSVVRYQSTSTYRLATTIQGQKRRGDVLE